MKAFLHTDNLTASLPWHNKFRDLLVNRYKLKIIEGDVSKDISWLNTSKKGDVFIGRFRFEPKKMLDNIKSKYPYIADRFFQKCFPSQQSLYFYDDKIRQANLFINKKYPTPKTLIYLKDGDPVLPFPCVVKKSYGAGSKNVYLAKNSSEIRYPCILQEFCDGNNGDIRITTIGNRVMGYARKNRPNDFRASGSGLLSYPIELPKECIRIANAVSEDNNFECMAYDFLKRNGKWVFVELSYTFIDTYIKKCDYYYTMPSEVKKIKTGVYPEELILKDLFKKFTF